MLLYHFHIFPECQDPPTIADATNDWESAQNKSKAFGTEITYTCTNNDKMTKKATCTDGKYRWIFEDSTWDVCPTS